MNAWMLPADQVRDLATVYLREESGQDKENDRYTERKTWILSIDFLKYKIFIELNSKSYLSWGIA